MVVTDLQMTTGGISPAGCTPLVGSWSRKTRPLCVGQPRNDDGTYFGKQPLKVPSQVPMVASVRPVGVNDNKQSLSAPVVVAGAVATMTPLVTVRPDMYLVVDELHPESEVVAG
jgi:hypothetical protein